VICPIVESALAPWQCRSPALICTTSPTGPSRECTSHRSPGFVSRLEMTVHCCSSAGTVMLHPTLACRVIRLQGALGEQLFDIAQRERISEIPAHGTQNQLWCRLPPLEDCRSGCMLHDLVRLPTTSAKVATHPLTETLGRGAEVVPGLSNHLPHHSFLN